MKRAVALITGGYQLLQVIWYSVKHPEYEYIALIKDANLSEESRIRLRQYCENAGIFTKILQYNAVTVDSDRRSMCVEGLKMLGFYLLGQRRTYTEKLIREQLAGNAYDMLIADSDQSILGGAFIDQADRVPVVILEEGLYDLRQRSAFPSLKLSEIIGFVIAKMGYCNITLNYKLKKTGLCEKVMSCPEKATCRNFASITKLFEYVNDEKERFDEIVCRAFPGVEEQHMERADVVLFTNTFERAYPDEFAGVDYYERTHAWLKENKAGKKIYIKRHPRDIKPYDWKDLDITLVDATLPSEVLNSQLNASQEAVFMFISTSILGVMNAHIPYTVFLYEKIGGRYRSIFQQLQNVLQIPEKNIEEV